MVLNQLEMNYLEASLAQRAKREAAERARAQRERQLELQKQRNLRIAAVISLPGRLSLR